MGTETAMPSGMLCSAMASAVNSPMRSSRAGGGSSMASIRLTSWGFSPSGIRRSMRAMTSMPPKNAAAAAQPPLRAPSWAVRVARASSRISTSET